MCRVICEILFIFALNKSCVVCPVNFNSVAITFFELEQ